MGKYAHSITLFYLNGSGKKTWHNAYIKNGSFLFRGFIDGPVYGGVMSDIKIKIGGPDVSNATELILCPGKITLSLKENDFEHAILTGSPVQDEWVKMQSLDVPINKVQDSLYKALFALERAGNTPANHIAAVAISSKIENCNQEKHQIDYNYITSHNKSYLSAYLLTNYIGTGVMHTDSIEMFYNAFSQSVKESVAGRAINRVIVNRKYSTVGSVIRMPAGINMNGSKFQPQSLKIDNYVLIYFWTYFANDNNNLKVLYDKYHPLGLKILAVSMDEDEKMWRDSIRKEQIGMWYNIFSRLHDNPDRFYNIETMPPSLVLLIDKKHKIIGRYRGKKRTLGNGL